MPKTRHQAGIPSDIDDGFSPDKDPPANLGHILQPIPAAKPRPSPAPKAPVAQKAAPAPTPPPTKPRQKAVPAVNRPPKRPKRVEIGSNDETERKMRRITQSLAEHGPQRDASNSEFLQAAAHLVERVHHSTNYAKLRPRGKWGTPTAREFIETLSGCYYQALGELYVQEHYDEIRVRVEAEIEREKQG